MLTNENYQVSQGSSLPLIVQLRQQDGTPAIGYAGTEALSAVVWPGGVRAASAHPAAVWSNAASGLVSLPITAAVTAALAAGRYQVRVTTQAGGGDPQDAYGCTLDVLPGPGLGVAPRAYGDYATLLRYGRGWLRQLQTDDDEAGYSEQLGRARSWLEDCAHAHFRVASMAMVVGGQATGPRRSGARSTWLQDQFDADALMVTDQVREACAKKALAFILEGQIGVGGAAGEYARLAKVFHSQADYLATCITLSLDTNGDGFPDVNIDLSSTDPFYG